MANSEIESQLPTATQPVIETTPATTEQPVTVPSKAPSTVALDKVACEVNLTETEMTPQSQPTKTATANLRAQFEQKTRLLHDFWQQQHQQIMKLNRDHSQLIIIITMSVIGILCSIIALSTNNWTCNSNTSVCYGLWNSCYYSERSLNNLTIGQNDSMTEVTKSSILCVNQDLNDIRIESSFQSRIDQVTASQALLIIGCILYAFSVVTCILAYRFINLNNLNSVRNSLVASILVQILTYFMLLVGFYFFIATERYSMSIVLMFVYFALAMIASNIINFITIEYKSFKSRQIAI